MFSQKKSTKPEAVALKPAAPSIISSDLSINGNLNSGGDIQVDGTVEGIAGSVTGQIKARHVTLIKTARVIADVVQERLSIEPGAFFEGNCRHFPPEGEKKVLSRLEPIKPAVRREGEPLIATAESVT